MAGKLNVEWTDSALNQVDKIYNFILNQWSPREADQFLDEIKTFEDTIQSFPRSFTKSVKSKNHHLGLINRHVSAVYRVKRKTVYIVKVLDNRTGKRL